MPARQIPKMFHVAFSFAGEQRDLVRLIAEAVETTLGRGTVFFDEWFEHYLAGNDADLKLQEIYGGKCALAVVCVSERYGGKPWTQAEHEAIRARLMKSRASEDERERESILPIRVGHGDIKGIPFNAIVPDVRTRGAAKSAELIIERLRLVLPSLKIDSTPIGASAPFPTLTHKTPPRVGNLRQANPMFVGRQTEMKKLQEAVFSGKVGVVTAVHGLGGMGKTELAVAFAENHVTQFPLGIWILEAEGKKEMLPLLGELVSNLDLPNSIGTAETGEQRGQRVLAELKKRVDEARTRSTDAALLLLLDNVSEPALLAGPQLDTLPHENWLRVVVTTRLGQDRLRAKRDLGFVPVDALDENDALVLFEKNQPDARWPKSTAREDKAAARGLARELGGFTLAVEAVALYLGQNPDIRPAAFLARVKREGLPSADALGSDPSVADQMRHREKQLSIVLESTLRNLDPVARAALDYAALLPPDNIPWPWLHTLVEREHPNALHHKEGYPDPWLHTRATLEGHRLLTPGNHPQIARLHRLVEAHLHGCMTHDVAKAKRSALEDYLDQFMSFFEEQSQHSVGILWLLQPLQETILSLAKTGLDLRMGENASIVGAIEMQRGRMDRALVFFNLHQQACDECLAKNPASESAKRNLSVSFNQLGDFLETRGKPGDAEKALVYFQRSLTVREQLFNANPDSPQAARDVSVSLNKLGSFLAQRGQPRDAEQALAHFQRSLEVRERLLAANPSSAQAARDVSVGLDKLGDFLSQRGEPTDAEQAFVYFQRILAINERLLKANPSSAQAARDVSVNLNKLGDSLMKRGQPGDTNHAIEHFQRSLKIREQLLDANPDSAQAARDVSVSVSKLGDSLTSRGLSGDVNQALIYFQRSLGVCERLLAANPDSADAARDTKISLERMAQAIASRSDADAIDQALDFQTRAVSIALELHERNPQSLYYGRSAAVSLFYTAQKALAAGQPEHARQYRKRCHAIIHELIKARFQLDEQMLRLYQQLQNEIRSSPNNASPSPSAGDPSHN